MCERPQSPARPEAALGKLTSGSPKFRARGAVTPGFSRGKWASDADCRSPVDRKDVRPGGRRDLLERGPTGGAQHNIPNQIAHLAGAGPGLGPASRKALVVLADAVSAAGGPPHTEPLLRRNYE